MTIVRESRGVLAVPPLCSIASTRANADPVGPAGPVVALAGQRFAICRGAAAFDAFDARNRLVASRGRIRDLCGNEISNGRQKALASAHAVH